MYVCLFLLGGEAIDSYNITGHINRVYYTIYVITVFNFTSFDSDHKLITS